MKKEDFTVKAELRLSPDDRIGAVDPRIYGSFVEHMGRCVYHGLYEPSHPTADADGFRRDVIALVRALQIPIIRYPGGNFVSGYRWEDGVGPRTPAPRAGPACTAWNPTGRHGRVSRWAKTGGRRVMMAVNLARGGREAAALLEYCNFPREPNTRPRVKKDARNRTSTELVPGQRDGRLADSATARWTTTRRPPAKPRPDEMMDPSLELSLRSSSFHMDPSALEAAC
jgi:alpha-N-arabinofuranosidase